MTHAIDTLIAIIFALFGLVMEAIGAIDGALAGLMRSAGMPPDLQIVVLLVVAILLIVYALRVLGGVFGLLLMVLLILLVMDRLVPGLHLPHGSHSILSMGEPTSQPL